MGKMSKSVIVVVVMVSMLGGSLTDAINHCQTYRFEKSMNSTVMQFTKEVVSQDYAVYGEFKSLHCCAKNYRSIEWFKNSNPYPWGQDMSSLILYPEAENQTIYTRVTSFADAGNYTCVVRNDTHKSEHNIELKVEGILPDVPLATFKPHDQFVKNNEAARLYCEAFIGKAKLSNSQQYIHWYRLFDSEQQHEVDGIQEQLTREDGQIVGSYLIIPKMLPEHYGRYLCRIDMSDDKDRHLEMTAYIFSTPTAADSHELVPVFLALIAAAFTIVLIFITKYAYTLYVIRQKRELNMCRTQAAAQESMCIRRV